MVVGLAGGDAVVARPLGALAAGAAAARRHRLARAAGAAVVHRHHHARAGDSFFAEFGRPRHAGKVVERPGSAWRAARLLIFVLFWVTFWPGAMLAGAGGAGGLGGAARAGAQVPAGLARAVLDRVRAGGDQAAALRAAALSGDRHPDRRRGRCAACCRSGRWLVRGTDRGGSWSRLLGGHRRHRRRRS